MQHNFQRSMKLGFLNHKSTSSVELIQHVAATLWFYVKKLYLIYTSILFKHIYNIMNFQNTSKAKLEFCKFHLTQNIIATLL